MIAMKAHLPLILFELFAVLSVVLVGIWISYEGGLSWKTRHPHKFNYHPLFMVVGLVYFMGHGLISFRVFPLTHRVKKYVHAGLNLVAAMFVVAGLIAIFQYHNEQNYSHLNSIHSWLGILTALLIFVQLLGGISVFQDFVKPGVEHSVRQLYKPWHVAIGIFMVTLVVACVCSGLQEQYGFVVPAPYSAHELSYNTLGLFVAAWGFIAVYILINGSRATATAIQSETKGLLEEPSASEMKVIEEKTIEDKDEEKRARRAARKAKKEAAQ